MKLLNSLRSLLEKEEYDPLMQMSRGHEGKVINGLIGLLTDANEFTKWRAVKALGQVTARLFSEDPERVKTVLRQLIWNLNEESGGIGWGMPEALGEILASIPALQDEYLCLLVAYVSEGGCFIENEAIQKGVIWGLGRIGKLDEASKARAVPFLLKALKNSDPEMQGIAAWAVGEMGIREAVPLLETLQIEDRMVKIFMNKNFQEKLIRLWAEEAIKKINQRGD
jgi:HEAT repeat protein